ncbi:hypothetical protein [Alicyclobacillus mengziensis]|uniref:Uncharacterized protein n=1 Tax=Alicyclobacillus mengziensis TaxID=2931921 RepID=A0A9X7W054_9BACL|nr:hypothetical protein [Alicyclobacillus mengziensis]QSO47805.1 hypothetical protein JZ786_01805 [Alicyclobacillus mengziensis]
MRPWSSKTEKRVKTEVVLMVDCKQEIAAKLEQIRGTTKPLVLLRLVQTTCIKASAESQR